MWDHPDLKSQFECDHLIIRTLASRIADWLGSHVRTSTDTLQMTRIRCLTGMAVSELETSSCHPWDVKPFTISGNNLLVILHTNNGMLVDSVHLI